MCLSRYHRMPLEDAGCAGVAAIELTYHRRISRRSKMRTKMDTEISYQIEYFVSTQLPSQNNGHWYAPVQQPGRQQARTTTLRSAPEKAAAAGREAASPSRLGSENPQAYADRAAAEHPQQPPPSPAAAARAAQRTPPSFPRPASCASRASRPLYQHTPFPSTPSHRMHTRAPDQDKEREHSLSAGKRASSSARARSSSSSSLW